MILIITVANTDATNYVFPVYFWIGRLVLLRLLLLLLLLDNRFFRSLIVLAVGYSDYRYCRRWCVVDQNRMLACTAWFLFGLHLLVVPIVGRNVAVSIAVTVVMWRRAFFDAFLHGT